MMPFLSFFFLSLTMSANNNIAMPPHPGLDSLTDVDKLKHLCPAFSKGCPYAKLEELDSLAVNRGEVSRW
jgi:hypothetical protein